MYFKCSSLFHPNQRLDKAVSLINVYSFKNNLANFPSIFYNHNTKEYESTLLRTLEREGSEGRSKSIVIRLLAKRVL